MYIWYEPCVGVKIIGGTNSAAGRPFGIFIKALVPDKAAKKCGNYCI